MKFTQLLLVSLLVITLAFPKIIIRSEGHNEIMIDQTSDMDYSKILSESSNYFIKNIGQIEEDDILFYSSVGNAFFSHDSFFFRIRELEPIFNEEENEFLYSIIDRSPTEYHERGIVLKYTFIGSNEVEPASRERCSWNTNYFKGNDPNKWHSEIPNYCEVIYPEIWDGIDLVYRIKDGSIKYDLVISPGANPDDIRFQVEGHESQSIDTKGDLIIGTEYWDILDTSLYAFQRGMGEIGCEFKLIDRNNYGFRLFDYDRSKELTIDPLLNYSTFIGGSGSDWGVSIYSDTSDNAYITGTTMDATTDYPTTSGAYDNIHNGGLAYGYDGFVTKLNSNGSSLLYSTFLGGSGDDVSEGICVDSSGNAYITGYTSSTDFPTTSGVYNTTAPCVFVTKLNSNGSSLNYSTFLGGDSFDYGRDICIDMNRSAYITGTTASTDYPTTKGAYDTIHNGDWDVFVTKLSSNGSNLIYSTFIGGGERDQGFGICVDSRGNAYITGDTSSTNYPTTSGAYDTSYNGGYRDIFVTKLNSNGSSLNYSTFLGRDSFDYGRDICIDTIGNAYITGDTSSTPIFASLLITTIRP